MVIFVCTTLVVSVVPGALVCLIVLFSLGVLGSCSLIVVVVDWFHLWCWLGPC